MTFVMSDPLDDNFHAQKNGILPYQHLMSLIDQKAIWSEDQIESAQVQPASLDLRLGNRAWRVRASFLSRRQPVLGRLRDVEMFEMDLSQGAVFEAGCVYIAKLQENLRLPKGLSARANPKSSTGRLDVFVRLLTDYGIAFDDVCEGYEGPLFLEIVPQTFSILVREGTKLNQLRIKSGTPPKLYTKDCHVNLQGDLIGYRARRHSGVIDFDNIDALDPLDFWEPLKGRGGELMLDPGEFYILASKNAVEIPVGEAAEMLPIDPSVGEFRVHYAGFFDPGFGTLEAGGLGAKGVLEVRCHEAPFLLEDGQTVARLIYEPLLERPTKLYGQLHSNYQKQGLKLSKHFKV